MYTVVVHILGYEEFKAVAVRIEADKTTELTIRLVRVYYSPSGNPDNGRKGETGGGRTGERVHDDTERRPGRSRAWERTSCARLQAVPGVLSVNDFSAQLVVRGSGPDQNLIIMDDIEVFNPYRLYGFISMFNPETVSDINLITGGFPARYGDRLSAVLDVTNREGEMHSPLHGSVNASITNANIVLSGGLPFGANGSFIVSARRTYYDLILGPIARRSGLVSGDVAFPNFMDCPGEIRH